MTTVPRKPPMPEHDPKRDGNPFAWIIRTASAVREARTAVHQAARNASKPRFD